MDQPNYFFEFLTYLVIGSFFIAGLYTVVEVYI